MANNSKIIQAHHSSFEELKFKKATGLKKKLKVPKEVEGETEKQRERRLAKIQENEVREKENLVLMDTHEAYENRKENFRGVRMVDIDQVIFGSFYRVARITLEETMHLDKVDYSVGEKGKATEQMVKLLDRNVKNAGVAAGTLETGPFMDMLYPFLKESNAVALKFSVLGEINIRPLGKDSLITEAVYESGFLFEEDFEFGINTKYFYDALKLARDLGHETVELKFTAPVRPIGLMADDFEYMLATIRLNHLGGKLHV